MELENSDELREKFLKFVNIRIKHVYSIAIPDFKGNVRQGYAELLDLLYTYDYQLRLCNDLKQMQSELFLTWE